MRITILGCGAAPGVPSVSTGWGRCDPAEPRNRRRRASILVEEGPTTLLVDCSPDLRDQLLDAGVRRLDAVLFTHAHADHIHGLDELREINRAMNAPLDVFGTAETLKVLDTRFGYAFQGIPPGKPIFRPWLLPHAFAPGETLAIAGVKVTVFAQDHGFSKTMGFRIGDAAYSTDLMDLPPESKTAIRGAKVWIVGGLQEPPHPSHANLAQALAWAAELRPDRTVITHMSNDLDYKTMVTQLLPPGAEPAFDGLKIDI